MKPNRRITQTTQALIDELLRPEQAALLLKVSRSGLLKWRMRGMGPKYLKLAGKAVRYRRSDLEAWLEQQQV